MVYIEELLRFAQLDDYIDGMNISKYIMDKPLYCRCGRKATSILTEKRLGMCKILGHGYCDLHK